MAKLLSTFSFATYVVAQFVPAPTDLLTKVGAADIKVRYKEVPAGICEQDPWVKSFSGYADVAENQHIFWWFFEARNDEPSKAPLTVWINGGPGSSSMIGKSKHEIIQCLSRVLTLSRTFPRKRTLLRGLELSTIH